MYKFVKLRARWIILSRALGLVTPLHIALVILRFGKHLNLPPTLLIVDCFAGGFTDMRIMQFDPAGSPNVLTAAMTVVLSITLGTSTPSKTTTMATTTTTAASFSVWFRPEPGLPRKRDMKAKKLNRLIGSDYDETWMSKTPMITAVSAEFLRP